MALLIKNEYAESAIKVKTGLKAEMLSVKLNAFSPAIVITAYYGSQPRTGHGLEERIEEIFEVFSSVKSAQENGSETFILGDANAWVGTELIQGNNVSVNREGLLFVELMKKHGMEFANDLLSKPATYRDKKIGTRKSVGYCSSRRHKSGARDES